MTKFLYYLKITGQASLLIILIAIAIMIAIFIITSALYYPVKKAIKYNLKKAEDYQEEQRIYLDKYHFVVENEDLKNQLEQRKSELRKISAELKSKKAELDNLNNPDKKDKKK